MIQKIKTEGIGSMKITTQLNKTKLNKTQIISLVFTLFAFLATNLTSQDIKSNLEAHWKLDCNTDDNSNNNSKLTLKNNPNCVPAKKDDGYNLDGVTQYLEMDSSQTQNYISKNGFTWSIWVKGDKLPQTNSKKFSQTLLSFFDNELAEDIYLGFGDINWEEKTLVFRVDGDGGAGELDINPSRYNLPGGFKNNEWYHIVAVRDYQNKKTKLYLNGTKVDEKNVSYTPIKRNLNCNIGKIFDGKDIDGAYFSGILDEIRIYSRAINDADVKLLYFLRNEQLKVENGIFNFGKLICNKDSTKNIPLINEGPTDFQIINVKLKNGTNFKLIDNNGFLAKYTEFDSIYNLPIRFTPDRLGIYYDTLILENNYDLPLKLIPIIAEKDTMNYEINNLLVNANNTWDLGTICPNAEKDIDFDINLTTNTDKLFLIQVPTSIKILDNASNTSIDIKGNENRNVKLRFTASSTMELIRDSISIIDECGVINKFYFIADIYEPTYSISLQADTIMCPQKQQTFYVEITNSSPRDLDWNFTYDNKLFEVENNITVAQNVTYKLPIKFLGAEKGGRQECKLLFDIGCGRLDSITFDIDIINIDVVYEINNIQFDTLDLGEILFCGSDTTITKEITIKNKNITPKINILQINNTANSIATDINIGDSLLINQTKKFNLSIRLKNIGEFEDLFSISINSCEFDVKLPIKANVLFIESKYETQYYLGQLKENTNIDTIVTFVNSGTAPMNIKGLNINNYQAQFVNFNSNNILNPNDTLFINLKSTVVGGYHSDTLSIISSTKCEDIENKVAINYLGKYIAKFDVTTGTNGVKPLIDMGLNLYFDNIINLDSSGIDSIIVRVGFNKSLLLPKTNKNFTFEDKNYVEKIYNISFNNLEYVEDKLGNYNRIKLDTMNVNWGDKSIDTIKILDMKIFGGYSEPKIVNGTIFFTDACVTEGVARLFGIDDNTLTLHNPTPNPSNSDIKVGFELIEDGNTKVEIFDISGNKVLVLINSYYQSGKYETVILANQLPLGSYFYVLTTPTQTISKRLQIIN